MDYDDFDEQPAVWGVVSPREGGSDLGLVRETLKKEQVIKEILVSQEALRAMMSKVQTVQKDIDKLASGNETLQMYIDNLTVQMAKRR
ncbi:hypothetical protein HYPSUDRAFT_214802 [Hypholoma sublateritium FD-334 SS-4]|uniref:Uncharacterized protein n=1 Tax=Hypholoma sublateritium (strain FD-334 SS-4) TaxID=945553 RepID=A0A0D2L9Z6_HYPSF|nr:hypothetical protein HYPSUDRAFT_214802 [Hypholoma sublateritium FD-334 SS-4]